MVSSCYWLLTRDQGLLLAITMLQALPKILKLPTVIQLWSPRVYSPALRNFTEVRPSLTDVETHIKIKGAEGFIRRASRINSLWIDGVVGLSLDSHPGLSSCAFPLDHRMYGNRPTSCGHCVCNYVAYGAILEVPCRGSNTAFAPTLEKS